MYATAMFLHRHAHILVMAFDVPVCMQHCQNLQRMFQVRTVIQYTYTSSRAHTYMYVYISIHRDVYMWYLIVFTWVWFTLYGDIHDFFTMRHTHTQAPTEADYIGDVDTFRTGF
jgi:hypothetical protein